MVTETAITMATKAMEMVATTIETIEITETTEIIEITKVEEKMTERISQSIKRRPRKVIEMERMVNSMIKEVVVINLEKAETTKRERSFQSTMMRWPKL